MQDCSWRILKMGWYCLSPVSYTHLVIEASQILGVNQDKIPVWKAMQEKMPSSMLNENGEIREWM